MSVRLNKLLSSRGLGARRKCDEIIASGYGARIVLLARPPGYGLGDVASTAK